MLNRMMKWACAALITGGFGILSIMSLEIFDYIKYTPTPVVENSYASPAEIQGNHEKSAEELAEKTQSEKEELTKENHFGRSTEDKKVDIENNYVSIHNEPGLAIHNAHQSIDNFRNGNIRVKGLSDGTAEEGFVTSIISKEIHTIRGYGYAEDDMTEALQLLDRYTESRDEVEKEKALQALDAIFYKLDRKHNAWDNHNKTVLP
ncbi:hypothetical protein [Sediminibacillus halophilus]|uniref:Uncharacterized protein n=1 Tax=Sediminibacillus halophilus TaxID=482461 RepID=A0A1G9TEP7_9BACI|nr:hypothetical protein [Sediminibacillus halophilus]SDM46221.1 hypothetical protein SAMN05216244_2558 [Sediminibacillus halophilus]